MPEIKCHYNLCSDKIYYDLSDHTLFDCKINPNVITAINLFVVTPLIFYCLLCHNNLYTLVLLTILRGYFDNLDGHIARKCNMKSRFGSMFDLFGDAIFGLGLILILIYSIWKNGKINVINIIFIIVCIFQIINFARQMKDEVRLFNNQNADSRPVSVTGTLLADNSVILSVIFVVIIKIYYAYNT